MNPMTHNFDYSIGIEFIRGQLYFDDKKVVHYQITDMSNPLSNDFVGAFKAAMDDTEALYVQFGEIKKIKIVPIS